MQKTRSAQAASAVPLCSAWCKVPRTDQRMSMTRRGAHSGSRMARAVDTATPARTMLGSHQRVNIDGVHLEPCEHGLQGSQHVLHLRATAWTSGTGRAESKQAWDLLSKAAQTAACGQHCSSMF